MSNIEEAGKFKALGNEAFSAKRYEEAIQHFTKAIELNPNDHVFYSNRSACYASLEDYEKALEDGTKCVNIKPEWAKGYTRKGLAEFYLEKYDDAEKTYQKGLELEPTNEQLKEGIQRVKEAREEGGAGGADGNPFGQKFMQQGFLKLLQNPETAAYFQDKDFMSKFMQIQKNPQSIGMYLNDPKIQKALQVIMSDFTGGAGAGAGAGFPFGADAGSKPSGEHQHHAGCSHDHGGSQKEETKDRDQPIIEEETSQPKYEFKPEPKFERKPEPRPEPTKTATKTSAPGEAEKNKGNDEYKKKNFDQAIIHYEKAIELEPTEPIYYNNLAAVYLELKQFDKAIETCDKAEEVAKNGIYDYIKLAKILARKASAYAQKGDYATSLDYYSKSLLENGDYKVKEEMKKIEKIKKEQEAKAYINPEISEQHRLKGNELYGQGKFPDSIKEYDEAIKRNPTDAKLYANRGTALMKLMDYPSALKDIEKCLELDPTYVKAYAKKGVIYSVLKEYHKSVEAYEKGLKVDPNSEECKSGLEKTRYLMMGGATETKEDQEIRAQRAMMDPEVRAILQDPQTMQILKDLQEKPRDPSVMAALSDPAVMKKIEKLIAAGIVKTG